MPFNSNRRYHLVVARDVTKLSEVENDQRAGKESNDGATFVMMMKGAPEVVLKYCNYLQVDKECLPIDGKLRHECQVNAQT